VKDNFSAHSYEYQKCRPAFPVEMIWEIVELVKNRNLAWDCGTGNGQVAELLSPMFEEVIATDISENQIRHSIKKNNIVYKVEAAETPSLRKNSVHLIIVAQAVHWFNFNLFYKEVNRILKQEGVIALLGYPLPSISPAIDTVIHHLYNTILRGYWDKERMHVDEEYRTIPFPFVEVYLKRYVMKYQWTFGQLVGFL
jgi:ubiquinone/menaquinone biosynthesis C-methylase UbiE